MVDFKAPTTSDQQHWLRRTRVRLRRVAFHLNDAASVTLLHDSSMLVRRLLPLMTVALPMTLLVDCTGWSKSTSAPVYNTTSCVPRTAAAHC